jgi:carbonic anhydrase/acetyltransferase-like protein (isoleucine patch superfamily)
MKTNKERFPDSEIGAGSVIGEGSKIGANSVIGAGSRIGADSRIGAGSVLEVHHLSAYTWNLYDDLRSGVPVKTLRFGCVDLPLSVFRDNLEALCARHASDILPELRDLLATL